MNIAIYIRLSNADHKNGESDSIINQRKYIVNFLQNNSTLSHANYAEFVDDGYSGTNDNRPKFKEMIELLKQRKFNVVCVKDFSRFFRDYTEAGDYLERIFPTLGIRFISINDNYDSDDFNGTTGGMEMVMRNIVYAAYSRDLSIKISTGKIQMMKHGKFIGSFAPFGYKKNNVNKNKLEIDEESSQIVKLIFNYALQRNGTGEIAKKLNALNIPTKSEFFNIKHPNSIKYKNSTFKSSWTANKVREILQNQIYTGDLVCHKQKKAGILSSKTIRQKPIIVENTHECIISKDDFKKAQNVIRRI